ncbi:MAG: queuosine precursor transporter, partial [Candidatus Tectomicrobia bacterium]|nr:queuosine precursor transporter [Candidatus Tectomicrobia bacterium]
VPAGVFIYALTFTLIDLINELLGKRGARRVVFIAFAANLLLALYTQLSVVIPAASFYPHSQAYAAVLGSTLRIVLASLTAYLLSSLLDVHIFAWWREKIRGPKWLRVVASNAVSTLVDSALFITLAFAGSLPIVPLIQGQYLAKMGITLISLPLIYLVRGLPLESQAMGLEHSPS